MFKKWTLFLIGVSIFLSQGMALADNGLTEKRELTFYRANLPQTKIEAPCPTKLMVTETAAPYQEGGYQWYGSANFSNFAQPFKVVPTADPFTVIWQADLKDPYQKCEGTAVPLATDDSPPRDYIKMKFYGGKVYFILDMTGRRDANEFTTVIMYAKIKDGMPIWSWGGTD